MVSRFSTKIWFTNKTYTNNSAVWIWTSHEKSTCLWLKGLQKLTPTNIVEPKIITYKGGAKFGAGIGQVFDENGKAIPFHDPRTAKARSKTFSGVAKAMADTWG